MENRKFIVFFAPLFIAGFFIANNSLAYYAETHSYLTDEAVNLFNKNISDKSLEIGDELKNYVLDGARREDDPPRWMNHFYDPEQNRGLTKDLKIDPFYDSGTWNKSVDWAQNDSEQKRLKYSPIIASILSSIQSGKIEKNFLSSDFTWNRAIKYWIKGDKEMAMFTLGHVLHLLEDLSVPDHTRNDPHADGSYFEMYSKEFTLDNKSQILSDKLKNEKPKVFANLNGYFDSLAKYSNNNFYSEDTIGIQSGYKSPNIDPLNTLPKRTYYYGSDSDSNIYKLAFNRSNYVSVVFSNKALLTTRDDSVASDYWALLSPKAVSYSAGLIDLFFREADRLKNDSEFIKEKKSVLGQMWDATKNTTGKIPGFLSGLFGNNGEQIGEVDMGPNNPQLTTNNEPIIELENSLNQKSATSTPKTITKTVKKYVVTRVIDGDTIVLDDGTIVRYIGIDAPEFSEKQDKTDCLGKESRERNKELVLNKSVRIETSKPKYDDYDRLLAYVFVQNTNGVEIMANESLIEEGLAYSYNFGNKHKRDAEFEKIESGAKEKKVGLWGEACPVGGEKLINDEIEKDNSETSHRVNKCEWKDGVAIKKDAIIINEVAWMGSVSSSNDEWIELKNISSKSVDLSGWQLASKDGGIEIDLSELKNKNLLTNKFLLLERTDDNSIPNETADLIYSGSLSNSNETLRLFDSSCVVMDEIVAGSSWPGGDNDTKKTMERTTYLGWQTSLTIGGTPGKENSSGTLAVRSSGGGGGGGGGSSGGTNQNNSSNDSSDGSSDIYKLYINEIMYNPAGTDEGREWIEIYNYGSSTIDVSKLKFNESDTNHSISAVGSSTTQLLGGEYGVIVQDINKFILDNPSFSGKAFDSTFSLSNDGEIISIKSGSVAVDSVSYLKSWGGDETGRSAQKFDSGWEGALPTPGVVNVKEAPPLPGTEENAKHVLISEVQMSGENSEDEFIELYNPTDTEVSLLDWSLQYISGRADSLSGISKKNFNGDIKIAPKSFYLITNSGGKYTATGDMNQSSISLSGENSGGIIFLVATTTPIESVSDSTIVDAIGYGTPILTGVPVTAISESGESIERTSIYDGNCVYPNDLQEFDGNGCDRESGDDFVIRSSPKPQNTMSLAEPRNAPSTPTNFDVTYDRRLVSLMMAWQGSKDYTDSSGGIEYEIIDGGTIPAQIIASTTSTWINTKVDDVGRNYDLLLVAKDRDGKSSIATSTDILVPSFVSDVEFYKSATNEKNYLNIKYDYYPFVPDPYGGGEGWSGVILYKGNPSMASNYILSDFEGQGNLNVFRQRCMDSPSGGAETSNLVLPNSSDNCRGSGELFNISVDYRNMEDNNLLFPVSTSTGELTSDDYASLVFYSANGSGSSGRNFRFVAVDRNKYRFTETEATHIAPEKPEILSAVNDFDQTQSRFLFKWKKVKDADTIDDLIKYQTRFRLSSESEDSAVWTDVTGVIYNTAENMGVNYSVVPEGDYVFEVRAKDEFGTFSEISSANIIMPSVSSMPLGLYNLRWGQDSRGNYVEFNVSDYGTFIDDKMNVVVFYLNDTIPDKITESDIGTITGDGKTKINLTYESCQTGTINDWSLYLNSGGMYEACSSGLVAWPYKKGMKFASGAVPSPGKIYVPISEGSYSASDYITMLVLKKTGDENYAQIARYLVPTYFSPLVPE